MKIDTIMPAYPSTGKVVNLVISRDIVTIDNTSISVKDSNADAFRAEELIAIPRYVVKRLRKIWRGIANNISKNATMLNGILTG